MPDLKDTILLKVLEQIETDLREGVDYVYNISRSEIKFSNGSRVISRSWHDNRFVRARSLELSLMCVEEAIENDPFSWKELYREYRSRLGRIPHVKENLMLIVTNPGEPDHPIFTDIIDRKSNTVHIYYSVTKDNPFLPSWYENKQREIFTEKECQRLLEGKWVSIMSDKVYYAFDENRTVIERYTPDPALPIILSYDFNIGFNKPISVSVSQYKKGDFFFYDEIVIQGARTADTIAEGLARGIISDKYSYIIRGDATGKARSTNSIKSDYEIIDHLLACAGMNYKLDVPVVNPPVRTRHNLVNGQLKNSLGETHVFITRNCEMHIKALKYTKLKDGANYIEDDSDPWQHIGTAIGYNIVRQLKDKVRFYVT